MNGYFFIRDAASGTPTGLTKSRLYNNRTVWGVPLLRPHSQPAQTVQSCCMQLTVCMSISKRHRSRFNETVVKQRPASVKSCQVLQTTETALCMVGEQCCVDAPQSIVAKTVQLCVQLIERPTPTATLLVFLLHNKVCSTVIGLGLSRPV